MISKKRVIQTISNDHPNSDVGGPRKIIDLILRNYNKSIFDMEYFSYTHNKNENSSRSSSGNYKMRPIKRIMHPITQLPLIRQMTQSQSYYYFYLLKMEHYFNKNLYKKKRNKNVIIHSHDLLSLGFNNIIKFKSILTVHNKGSLIYDLLHNAVGIKYSPKTIKKLLELEKKSIFNASVITFPSRGAFELYKESANNNLLEKKDIRIIYNGVQTNIINSLFDKQILEKYSISISNNKILLNVANHIEPKNIKNLIMAMKQLYPYPLTLINIGWGHQTEEIKQLISDLGLHNKVYLLGKIPNDDVIKIMKLVDFFIMPSDKVVFDLVNLEALAVGLPLLLSKNGGNLEIIDEGKNGFFINNNTPEEISKSIITLLNSNLTKGMIDKSRCIDVNKMVTQYQQLYEELSR